MDAQEITVRKIHVGHFGKAPLGRGVEYQEAETHLIAPNGNRVEIEGYGFETKVVYRTAMQTVDLTRHQQRYFPTHDETVAFWRERLAEFETKLAAMPI